MSERIEEWLNAATRGLTGRSRLIARVYLRGNKDEIAAMEEMLNTEKVERDKQERREKNARIDEIETRSLAAGAREAYYIDKYGTPEEKKAYAQMVADERKKKTMEERAAICQDVDYITTRHMTPASRESYYIYTYGSKEEIAAYEARCEEERRTAAREERIETENYQRKESDRLDTLRELKQPLEDIINGDVPPESEVLVGVIKNIMEMERRWSFRDDDKTVAIRDFLDQALQQMQKTIAQTKGIYTEEADKKLSDGVSKYLKILRAAHDAGYTHLNMKNEFTYYLNSDENQDLGFQDLRDCLFRRRKDGHNVVIELPRDYSKGYPQNYAGALEILNAMQSSFEGKLEQAQTEWKLLGYKSPVELRETLRDMSLEDRQALAKSGDRGALEWGKVQAAAQRHGTRARLPYGLTPEKIAEATVRAGTTVSGLNAATATLEEAVNPTQTHDQQQQQ